MTEEVEQLLKEFVSELNFVAGSIMLLEDRVGSLEAGQFSTTTKLKGKSTFTMGATTAYGTKDGSEFIWDYDRKHKIVEIDGRESPLGSTQNSRSWQKNREAWRAVHNRDGSLKEKDSKNVVRRSSKAPSSRSITKTFELDNIGTIEAGKRMHQVEGPGPTTVSTGPLPSTMSRS